MKVIIKRTLEETLRISSIILVILAGVAGGYVVGINCNHSNATTFVKYLNECLIIQHMAVFFLINGAILMIIVASIASGLIAGEVHEGTIRLLVAKPNSRRSILLGKIIGMLTGCIILMLMGLGVFFLTESYFGNFDGNVQAGMLAYFPAYIMYGLIVIAFFSSLATLLSCLVKKKVIALLPMLFLMICILALPDCFIIAVYLRFATVPAHWFLATHSAANWANFRVAGPARSPAGMARASVRRPGGSRGRTATPSERPESSS